MAMTDPIADLLTRIRNGMQRRHAEIKVPASHLKAEVSRVLQEEGFIQGMKSIEEAGHPHLSLRLRYQEDRKSTRLNSSHANISYAVFCLKKKTKTRHNDRT